MSLCCHLHPPDNLKLKHEKRISPLAIIHFACSSFRAELNLEKVMTNLPADYDRVYIPTHRSSVLCLLRARLTYLACLTCDALGCAQSVVQAAMAIHWRISTLHHTTPRTPYT